MRHQLRVSAGQCSVRDREPPPQPRERPGALLAMVPPARAADRPHGLGYLPHVQDSERKSPGENPMSPFRAHPFS